MDLLKLRRLDDLPGVPGWLDCPAVVTVDFVKVAEGCGLRGVRIDPTRCRDHAELPRRRSLLVRPRPRTPIDR